MDKIINEFYVIDNLLFRIDHKNDLFNNSTYQFYEVIRVTKKVYLFLEDHLARLADSFKQTNLYNYYNEEDIMHNLKLLLQKNKTIEGNVKLVCKVQDNKLRVATYYIPHYYPNKEQYENGVSVKSFHLERSQPNLKQINVNEYIKSEINTILQSNEYFEVLLINQRGCITEGSKSNIFFIKGNNLFSAPENLILKGITRKYVLEIVNELGTNYIEEVIHIDRLNSFEAAFISGTSPKILPVYNIDNTTFSISNKLMREIMSRYNKKIENYIKP